MGTLLWSFTIYRKVCIKIYFRKTPDFIKHIYTMLFVIVGWLFFASEDLGFALNYLKVMGLILRIINSIFGM